MRSVALLLAGVLVAACTVGASGPSSVAVMVPTFKPLPSGECPTAQLTDVQLRGDETANPPVWVEDVQGKKLSILWPNGFGARFDPKLALIGPTGDVIARDGDQLDLTGGQVDPAYDFFACEIVNRTSR